MCLTVVLLVSAFTVRELLSDYPPSGDEYQILAEQLLSNAREEFEKIRNKAIREVTLEVVNKSWIAKNWGTPSTSELEEFIREENIYKALFMISQDVNLSDAQLEWMENFRAAKWQNKIYLVEENFDVTDVKGATATLIHELTHIMQENYFFPDETTFDGGIALSSLKEGDATFMADIFKNEGVIPTSLSISSIDETNLLVMILRFGKEVQPSLPHTVNMINWFPYRYGVEFIKKIHSQGGWYEVEKLYFNPPNTTEQIMHLEKYYSTENELSVEAPLITSEWNLIKSDRLGEYFIFVMLDNWISEDSAKNASKGWGGDVFNYYEKNNQFLFTWNIIWDTEDDAHEFYIAFQEMMYKTTAEKYNCKYWEANGRYISIQWNKNSTIILSSADETFVQQQSIY